ncbi:sphingosine N-acyltransferase lag1 [Allomyces arbusculus]|nr:sphingosine N-acyltransferase lag1 [Allomyces arbusculus]
MVTTRSATAAAAVASSKSPTWSLADDALAPAAEPVPVPASATASARDPMVPPSTAKLRARRQAELERAEQLRQAAQEDEDAALLADDKGKTKGKSKVSIEAEWQPSPLMRLYRDHQLDVPLAILIISYLGAAVAPTSVFAQIAYPSYRRDEDGLFAKGRLDLAFIAYYVVFWTFARAFCIDYMIKPLGRSLRVPKKLLDRFGEQGWLVVYYSTAFSVGFNHIYNSPYWMNTEQFWIDYPHKFLTGEFKAYYLLQLAFWIQQMFVVHIEKPRKDYAQYVVHHLVTCALLVSSYLCHFTRIGNAVLVTMDVADIFLCAAKCCNYAKLRKTCDSLFVTFVLVWLVSRHYVYFFFVRSIWVDVPNILEFKWDPQNEYYISSNFQYFFLALFGILQVLLVFWLYLIVRVVLRVVRGSSAEDNRSDDEE